VLWHHGIISSLPSNLRHRYVSYILLASHYSFHGTFDEFIDMTTRVTSRVGGVQLDAPPLGRPSNDMFLSTLRAGPIARCIPERRI
jgi:hypothetical protein